jgi:MraZ protein
MLRKVAVTSSFKKQLATSLQNGFVLKRSVQPCHGCIYEEFDDAKINKLNRFVKKKQ